MLKSHSSASSVPSRRVLTDTPYRLSAPQTLRCTPAGILDLGLHHGAEGSPHHHFSETAIRTDADLHGDAGGARRHVRPQCEFYNPVPDTATPARPVLVRKNANQAGHVVVAFCPQHVMEQALYEVDEKASKNVKPLDPDIIEPTQHDPLIEPPLGARLADPSRLPLRPPDEVLSIPFTEAGLLDWNGWIPNVAPTARASGAIQPFRQGEAKPKLEPPGKLETAIELPWWLIISPHVHTGWNHRPDPVTHGGRTELWHTRLGGRSSPGTVDETDTARMTIRAIWARDPNFQKYLNNPA